MEKPSARCRAEIGSELAELSRELGQLLAATATASTTRDYLEYRAQIGRVQARVDVLNNELSTGWGMTSGSSRMLEYLKLHVGEVVSSVIWADPPEEEDRGRAFSLDFDPRHVRSTYCRPFRALLTEVESGRHRASMPGGRTAETIRLTDSEVEVGLATEFM